MKYLWDICEWHSLLPSILYRCAHERLSARLTYSTYCAFSHGLSPVLRDNFLYVILNMAKRKAAS